METKPNSNNQNLEFDNQIPLLSYIPLEFFRGIQEHPNKKKENMFDIRQLN